MAIPVEEFAVLLFAASETGAAAVCLPQRQDPVDGRLEVFVADLVGRVGNHRHLPPAAGAAVADLVEEHGRGLGVALVFGGDFLVGRADALGVDGVAGDAAGFLDDGFAVGVSSVCRCGEGGGCEQGQQQGGVQLLVHVNEFLGLNEAGRLQFGPFGVGEQPRTGVESLAGVAFEREGAA